MFGKFVERIKNYVNNLFENSGKYLKKYAKIIFWIEAVFMWVIALITLLAPGGMSFVASLIFAAVIIVLAIPLAWLSVVPLYAFGEIVERLGNIDRNTRGKGEKPAEEKAVDDERLAKAEDLLAKGIITEEEYQRVVTNIQQ